MSDSEVNFDALKASEAESSDDEPLVAKKISSPKKAKLPKKKSKKDKKKSKLNKKAEKKPKVAEVSFSLVPTKSKKNESETEAEYEVEAIVGHREYNGKLVYKIRWKGYEAVHDTWEDYNSLSCPDLLESYNIKHSVVISTRNSQKKRKVNSVGRPTKKPKKNRSSVSSDESDDVPYDEGSEADYEVDKIVEMRAKRDGTREFLVHWKRWSSNYDTWEPEEHLSCPDLIEKFMQRIEKAKNSNVKELRTERKHTERFTLNTCDSGRRLSKRNNNKQRVKYYDAEALEEA